LQAHCFRSSFLVPSPAFASAPVDVNVLQAEFTDAAAAEPQDGLLTVTKKKDKIQIDQKFFFSLVIDLAAVFLILIFVYYPNYKKMDTIFTFMMFNLVIFLLTFVLNEVKMSMGAAFGLFAIFSMLRYRTAGINMKDMTYLFIFIAMGLVSAIQLEYHELAIITGIIFVGTLLLDTRIVMKKEYSNILRYEKIEMIKPDKREELIAELRERTGLNIHRVSINEIDFLKDTAMISYYYYEK
jgi:cation transport ATPase